MQKLARSMHAASVSCSDFYIDHPDGCKAVGWWMVDIVIRDTDTKGVQCLVGWF